MCGAYSRRFYITSTAMCNSHRTKKTVTAVTVCRAWKVAFAAKRLYSAVSEANNVSMRMMSTDSGLLLASYSLCHCHSRWVWWIIDTRHSTLPTLFPAAREHILYSILVAVPCSAVYNLQHHLRFSALLERLMCLGHDDSNPLGDGIKPWNYKPFTFLPYGSGPSVDCGARE